MKTPIYPRCKMDIVQDYVTADGYVMPCCWMADAPNIPAFFELYKDCLDDMSALHRPLEEILADPRYQRIEQTWETDNVFPTCVRQCGKPLEIHPEGMRGSDKAVEVNLKRK